jgi:hypothetical protein
MMDTLSLHLKKPSMLIVLVSNAADIVAKANAVR